MPLQFHILTLFPSLFDSPFSASILSRGVSKGLLEIQVHDIRSHTTDKHRTVDDIPFGGGPGMVMKPEPIVAAIEAVTGPGVNEGRSAKIKRIYFSPQGRPLKQESLSSYLEYDQLVLLCGRYEGVDERVIEHFIDEEVSIGDYILTGGEFAAMVFVDAVSRLVPGVVGSKESLKEESFCVGAGSSRPGAQTALPQMLEYPQYTRPPDFRGLQVPEVLLSGDHKKIEAWRREQATIRTKKKRPDLL